MSTSAPTELTGKTTARPGVLRARLRRLEEALVGAVASASEVAYVPLVAVGALVELCRHVARKVDDDTNGCSSISLMEVSGVLERRGMSASELSGVLLALCASGVLVRKGDSVTIPSAASLIQEHLVKFSNRSAGRAKCKGAMASTPAGLSGPRQAALPPNRVVEGVPSVLAPARTTGLPQDALFELAGEVAGKKAKQRLDAGTTVRFGAVDGQEPEGQDPTVARIVCECGGVVEVTQGYVEHLAGAYRGLDVLSCIRQAAVWCDGNRLRRKKMTGVRKFIATWLSTASRDADVRAAVVRSGSVKGNGFGHGGQYAEKSEVAAPVAVPVADLDFSDMTGGDQAVDARESLGTRLSSVQTARARRSNNLPQASRPAAQLRLSQHAR